MIQQMLAVLAVIALTMILLPWLRRRGAAYIRPGQGWQRSGPRLEALERLPLPPQHSLHIVRMDGRSLLIGVSPAGCALLERDKAETNPGESI